MKIKSNIKKSFLIINILLLLFLCFNLIYKVLNPSRKSDFLSFSKPGYDVLFLGDSHLQFAAIPMVLWNDYGISSFNLATSATRVSSNYWVLKNALEYCKPKAVVLELSYLVDEKTVFPTTRAFFDALPLSKLKYDAAFDLFEADTESALDFIFPFMSFHNRWNDLTENDFEDRSSYLFGYNPAYKTGVCELPRQTKAVYEEDHNISAEYVKKIIELCLDENIEIILCGLPFNVSPKSQNDLTYGFLLSKQYGINYLGPDEILENINPKTDFNDHTDDNSHLNFSGASKFSEYVGRYLQENYSLPDHRSEDQYQNWNEYYKGYFDYKKTAFPSETDVYHYLIKCMDKDFRYFIEINNTDIAGSSLFVDLFQNIGINIDQLSPNTSYLFGLDDKGAVERIENPLNQIDQAIQTNIGKIAYISDEDKSKYQFLWNDNIIYTGRYSDIYQSDIRISVIDKNNNDVIDSVFWNIIESKFSPLSGKRR